LAIAEAGLKDAQASNRKMLAAAAHRFMGTANFYLGELAAARSDLEHALRLYDESWAEAYRVAAGFDFLCGAHAYLTMPLAAQGEVEAAGHYTTFALQRGRELNQPFGLGLAYTQFLFRLLLTARPGEALRVAGELSAIASEKALFAWDLHAKLYGSWASARVSHPSGGTEAVRETWSLAKQTGARIYNAIALLMLADIAVADGATEEALDYVAKGLETVTAQSAAFALAPFHRLRGQALAANDARQAEAAFHESIRIAREQGARTFALQAAMPLARLLQTNNRQLEAYDALAPALEGFSPTPHLPAIAQAQMLLAELRASEPVATELCRQEVR
jgi:hypothetical protein